MELETIPEQIEPKPVEETANTKRVYIIAVALLMILLLGVGLWMFFKPSLQPEQPLAATTTPDVEQAGNNETNTNNQTDTPSTSKTYKNDEWGFGFEYPNDWEIRTPAFHSAASLFNLALDPVDKHDAEVIVLNISPKDWVEKALVKMKARGVVVENITFSGRDALRIDDKDGLGRSATITLIVVDGEYWIDITGVKSYGNLYNQILDSFTFTK